MQLSENIVNQTCALSHYMYQNTRYSDLTWVLHAEVEHVCGGIMKFKFKYKVFGPRCYHAGWKIFVGN